MTDETTDELASGIPATVLAVGEPESVRDRLRTMVEGDELGNIARGSLRAALSDLLEHIDARIEQLDEPGSSRAWMEAWRRAERQRGPAPTLRLESRGLTL